MVRMPDDADMTVDQFNRAWAQGIPVDTFVPVDGCDCTVSHPTPDSRCVNRSVRSEAPGAGLDRLTRCSDCMADMPDVHPTTDES